MGNEIFVSVNYKKQKAKLQVRRGPGCQSFDVFIYLHIFTIYICIYVSAMISKAGQGAGAE